MRVPVVIPFKPKNPKTRLSDILTLEEREQFALCMLRDVVHAVRDAGCEPRILSTAPLSDEIAPIQILEEGLNETINAYCIGNEGPLAIVMADLALADRSSVIALLTSGADLAIVPGRGGGTNAVYIRSALTFQAQYYGMSYSKHLRYGQDAGLTIKIIDSFRLYSDVDERDDLVEVLLHNTGHAKQYLEKIGFSLEDRKSRIGISR